MSQPEIFFSETEDLKNEIQSLKINAQNDQQKIKHYEEEVERLHEMLAELLFRLRPKRIGFRTSPTIKDEMRE